MDSGFGLFTRHTRPELSAVPGLLVKCQVAMRTGILFFQGGTFRIGRSTPRAVLARVVPEHAADPLRPPSTPPDPPRSNSSAIDADDRTGSRDTPSKEIEGKNEASRGVHRSVVPLFPLFVAVSDPFTKQSR